MSRCRLFFAALLAGGLFSVSAQAAVLIMIDKSIQQMTVEVDGRPLYQWPVSTGRAGYDTPSGKFRAFRMERDHLSKEWDDAPMPFSIFFTEKGHAIHGSYDKRIGQPASHGCVRLAPANAEKLFSLVEQEGVLNTTVVLSGQAPSGAPAVARRALPRPDDLDPYASRYGQPPYGQQNGQPQYGPPQYGQSQYGQSQYGQPQYRPPQYGQPPFDPRYGSNAPVYVDPYAAQPQYRAPYAQDDRYQTYRSRDPYAEPYQAPRYRGSLFD